MNKGLHYIKHKRPKWYTEYHQWEHHATLHWITFVVSSVVIMMGFFNVVSDMFHTVTPVSQAHADTASTNVTQNVNAGLLTLTNTGDQTLTASTVSTSNQNTTGSLGTITVSDARGTGVGWNATATSTQFIKYNAPVTTGGSNSTLTVDSSATYDNATQGTYTVSITSGGAAGVATFAVSGLETATGTTGTGVSVGTRGLVLNFASATYTTSDSWTIRVDVIPVSGFEVTPGSLTTNSGVSTNVTAGSVHTFSSTSDAMALISAAVGYGLGSYSVTPSLQLTVPANSYANSYVATVVETVL